MRPEGLSDDAREVYLQWFKGNVDALDLWDTLASVVNIWDDLIDGDREVSPAEINGAFLQLFIDLGRNPFFREFEAELRPVLEQSIHDWLDSNDLIAAGRLEAAFVLRCGYLAVPIRAATILGGFEWARRFSMELRVTQLDDFEDFKTEHGG